MSASRRDLLTEPNGKAARRSGFQAGGLQVYVVDVDVDPDDGSFTFAVFCRRRLSEGGRAPWDARPRCTLRLSQAPVAQGIERSPPEREVAGSNPAGRTREFRKPSRLGATLRPFNIERTLDETHHLCSARARAARRDRDRRRCCEGPRQDEASRGEGSTARALPAAAAYLGVTPVALRTELRSGKSLAQVATAKGKSVDGLKTALVAAIKTKVDAAKAAGKLDAARADRLLQRAPQLVERLVNAKPRAHAQRAKAARGGLLKTAATYLGVTNAQLVTDLRAGKSLAAGRDGEEQVRRRTEAGAARSPEAEGRRGGRRGQARRRPRAEAARARTRAHRAARQPLAELTPARR